MIGIKHVSVEIPPGRLDNLARQEELDFDENFLRSKIGAISVSRLAPEDNTIDLASRAMGRLLQETGLPASDVDLLVLVTQTPCTGGIPHLSAILHHRMGLRQDCHFFDVALGCSGWVQGLSIVKGYCASHGLKTAVLVTADPYSKILDPGDRNSVLLFGDGAAATLLTERPVFSIGKFALMSDTQSHEAIRREAGGFFQMNGRRVMEFGGKLVPASIRQAIAIQDEPGLKIDRYFVHQGSKYIVDQLRRQMGASEYEMPYCSTDYGNLVSSSIPVVLKQEWDRTGNRAVVCGFGVGLTSAATVLSRLE